MIVTPLGLHSGRGVAEALRAHGWTDNQAANAAEGLLPLGFRVSGLDAGTQAALAAYARDTGLELLSGDGWALVAGSRARFGAFARPWMVPPPLADLATAIARAIPATDTEFWLTAGRAVPLGDPVVMGIVNVTPDSFSDGGELVGAEAAVARAHELVAQGADLLDVGGESTRPGRAATVPAAEEIARVVPAIRAIGAAFPGVPISVDTTKAEVADAALDAGAVIVNDVSGGRLDPALLPLVARRRAGLVLMHSRGTSLELASYDHADYGGDVLAGVLAELGGRLDAATSAGVVPDAIVLDPGLGFAKTPAQSLELLDATQALLALGRPLLVGPSRKRFLGEVTGRDVRDRDVATAAACALAFERGARIFRVHAPAPARDALRLAAALRSPVPS